MFHKTSLKNGVRMFNLSCFNTILHFPDKVKVSESGIKWQKSIVLRSMAGMKNLVKESARTVQHYIFCHTRRTDYWPDGWTNMTYYTDANVTYIDQKEQT